ncbi:MAG: AMP-binding protein, partial [Henriciella sp.]
MDVVKSLVRHYTILSAAVRTGRWIKGLEPDSQTLMPDMIEDVVDRFPNHAAFRFEGRLVTYREFDFLANQVAHWAIAQGMKPGDTVALFMENRPEYAAIWYGLSKVGIVAGLINSNLTSNALAHCVNIAGAKHVIIGEEQDAAIATALDLFDEAPVIWAFGGEAGKSFSAALASMPSGRPERTYREGLRGRD